MAIKIPTYTSTGTITTQTAGRVSGARLDPRQTPAGAFASTRQFLVNDYIQEKQTEANNESYQKMNDFYIDEKDDKGNITQKGLMTIISEGTSSCGSINKTSEKSLNHSDRQPS